MVYKPTVFIGVLAFASLPTLGLGAETGTSRLTTVVTTQQGGGDTTTNTISYNARGLPSQFAIKGEGSFGVSGTVILTYNASDQVTCVESDFRSPFGGQTETANYIYEAGGAQRLISVESTVSTGYIFVKQFSYGTEGRVVGMTLQGEGPDGPISAVHTVDYDEMGRLVGNSHTYSAGPINEAGFYNVEYDDDGFPLSHTNKQPLNAEVSGSYSHMASTITLLETMGNAGDGTGFVSETVSTFAPGLCQVPKISDGYTVEQLFNGPPGYHPKSLCRD